MKTGKIVSSTPASISTASSILTKFVSSENGASQAANAYLRRATAALEELVRIHSKSDRKKNKKDKSDGVIQILEVSQEHGCHETASSKKQKKKKGGRDELEVNRRGIESVETGAGSEEPQSKKKKRRRSIEGEN